MFSFIDQLDKYNNQIESNPTAHSHRKLNSREHQYQQFLFYKYFFANSKPLIVTEGKTDIVYLKAALKNLYKEYPSLIQKKHDHFDFKISFLKRSKRLRYFFGFSLDGADSMKNLYNYFSDENSHLFPNYLAKLSSLSCHAPSNPVIFIFDNELNNSKKPLANFLNHAKVSQENKNLFQEKLKLQLWNNGNLFVVTNPLIDDASESEIENLFDKETLNHKINGRSLSLKSDYDTSKHYGKETFSKFIQSNYQTINFSNFKKTFDSIEEIVKSYNM